MWENLPPIKQYENIEKEFFEQEIIPRNRPAILKGAVANWPLIEHSKHSPEKLCEHLKKLAQTTSNTVEAWWGSPEMKGRFFYDNEISGRNFTKKNISFADLLSELLGTIHNLEGPHIFAGAISLSKLIPQLEAELKAPFLQGQHTIASLWIGNRTITAAHWDLPQNLACVIAGKRRFITFPITQINNLYFGPINNTLAGQAISLVDFYQPDHARFPLFQEAMKHAEIAELEAGDVLYMPSMCIHHVESLENFGAMVNFWWRSQPQYMNTPLLTLCHALTTLRELPTNERAAWKTLFDYYIFEHNQESLQHIPTPAKGLLSPLTPEIHKRIEDIIRHSLA